MSEMNPEDTQEVLPVKATQEAPIVTASQIGFTHEEWNGLGEIVKQNPIFQSFLVLCNINVNTVGNNVMTKPAEFLMLQINYIRKRTVSIEFILKMNSDIYYKSNFLRAFLNVHDNNINAKKGSSNLDELICSMIIETRSLVPFPDDEA